MTLNDIKFEPLIETLTVGKISDQEYFSKNTLILLVILDLDI